MFTRVRNLGASWLLLLSMVAALAAVVTAAQVADAVRSSSTANAWLKANADAVGRLAMFESSGRTDVYNGSCCYGVLQMNTANIGHSGYTTAQFQQLSLQDQVNAWAEIMSDALRTSNPQRLAAMETFDGREVTGDMVLSCVQLGIGNCGKMIRSGSCSGFADRNGTTICDMAQRIATGNSSPAGSISYGSGSPGSSISTGSGTGGLVNVPSTYDGNFETGSGVQAQRLRTTLQIILLGTAALVLAAVAIASWEAYRKGQIALPGLQRHLMTSGVVFALLASLASIL